MRRFQFGDIELFSLLDTTFQMTRDGVHPDLGARSDRPPQDSVPHLMSCLSFVVRTEGHVVLVDTGQGPEASGLLPAELAATGIGPSHIDTVFATHLHGDHTGWNIDRSNGEPHFSNARYLVPRADWEHRIAQSPRQESFKRDVEPLMKMGRLQLVGDEFAVNSAMTAQSTPGHTPGHLSLRVTTGDDSVFVLGDVVLSLFDVEDPALSNNFDSDGTVAEHTRRTTLARLSQDGVAVAAAHLPSPGVGRFMQNGAGFAWVPVNCPPPPTLRRRLGGSESVTRIVR